MSVPAAFTKCEPLITVDQFKARYLFGIDLTDRAGNPMPDETIQFAIESAISFLELKLDIVIAPRTIPEEHDYRAINTANFNFMTLKHRPIIKVNSVKARFSLQNDLLEYPEEWYVLDKEAGQLQLVPVTGSIPASFSFLPGTLTAFPMTFGSTGNWPKLFHIEYDAGFCNGNVPAIINEMIGLQAAYGIFDILGDIILGIGSPSTSVSIDGTSTSRTNSAGAGTTVFSARMKSYKTRLDDYIEVVRQHYNGIPFTVV